MSTSLAIEILVVDLIPRTKTGISESVFEIRAMISLHVSQVLACQSYSKVRIKKGQFKKKRERKPQAPAIISSSRT
jgi:hypothetical protein